MPLQWQLWPEALCFQDILRAPWGSFFHFGTNSHLEWRLASLDFGAQRSGSWGKFFKVENNSKERQLTPSSNTNALSWWFNLMFALITSRLVEENGTAPNWPQASVFSDLVMTVWSTIFFKNRSSPPYLCYEPAWACQLRGNKTRKTRKQQKKELVTILCF